jgi:hypothetical protein
MFTAATNTTRSMGQLTKEARKNRRVQMALAVDGATNLCLLFGAFLSIHPLPLSGSSGEEGKVDPVLGRLISTLTHFVCSVEASLTDTTVARVYGTSSLRSLFWGFFC